jgi:hypothetical protein
MIAAIMKTEKVKLRYVNNDEYVCIYRYGNLRYL